MNSIHSLNKKTVKSKRNRNNKKRQIGLLKKVLDGSFDTENKKIMKQCNEKITIMNNDIKDLHNNIKDLHNNIKDANNRIDNMNNTIDNIKKYI